MKRQLILLLSLLSLLVSCDYKEDIDVCTLSVQLAYPADSVEPYEGVRVELKDAAANVFVASTDADGIAVFEVPPGIYEASTATQLEVTADDASIWQYTLNGVRSRIIVSHAAANSVPLEILSAKVLIQDAPGSEEDASHVIIKELYNGGCLRNDGSNFQFDKCVVLYNNGSRRAVIKNLCFGMGHPANGQARNDNYGSNGRLSYESEGFIPVWNGIWYYPETLTIEPYSQAVINIHGAIDNTLTVTRSINYANAEYYCMYDPESGYNQTNYNPSPSELIPTSHYLKAVRVGLGTAWPFSVSSPALVVFQVDDPAYYAAQSANIWYPQNVINQVQACVKVPNENIIDGMEVFSAGYKDSSTKRLTADVDAGYVWLTNYLGHSLYRNVNRDATEALPENEGKLVYGYSLGTGSSTDPSGIDAEASMRNGAHIIFQDTNNSSSDFHERQQCSLKD